MAIAVLEHSEHLPDVRRQDSAVTPSNSRSSASHICVAVRCRPLDSSENAEALSLAFPSEHRLVVRHNGDEHAHKFDHIFGPDASQDAIFQILGAQLLEKAIQGFDNTVFAYGQTGSGKTFTMMNINAQPEARGFFPRLGVALFNRISVLTKEGKSRRFQVGCSLLEIYNEVIHDLLAPRQKEHKRGGLEVKEQKGIGVYVCGLTEVVVKDPEGLMAIVSESLENRATGPTRMNDVSSRSHCVLTLKLRHKDEEDGSKNFVSKVNLVDLAGSERVVAEDMDDRRAMEGANINKSLSALGNVITALTSMAAEGQKKAFIPYRNSKLTRVLQESLGGNALCTMIATIRSSASSVEETLATLKFARRAKEVRIAATKNSEAAQVVRLQQEIEVLRGSSDGKHKEEIEVLQSYMKQSWEDAQRLSEQIEEERESAKKDAIRAAKQLKLEQKRRLQMLEQHGDVLLTVKAVNDLNSRLCGNGWLERIGGAIKVGEQLRAEIRALKIFREGVGADLVNLWSVSEEDATATRVLLGPVQKKLASLLSELDVLIGINAQLEEQMGSIIPELTLALHTAREELDAGQASQEELVELLILMLRQYEDHYTKERASFRQEVLRMGLREDLEHLSDRLSARPLLDLGLEDDEAEIDELIDEMHELMVPSNLVERRRASLCSRRSLFVDPDIHYQLPKALGISFGSLGENCLSASSNVDLAKSARLLHPFGGWSPETDGPDEYLEIDLGSVDGSGESRIVAGLSLQGRSSCTGSWQQTRELLRLVLNSSESGVLNVPETTFMRPPVRFVYDIAVLLVHKHLCFGGDHALQIPVFADMSREQKAKFFLELIEKVRRVSGSEDINLEATPQDILSGKNCTETHRLLQLLCCLSLQPSRSSDASRLGGAVAQWTTFWKLRYLDSNGSWHWYGAQGDTSAVSATVFCGSTDANSVKFVRLPEAVEATKLRVHPEEWHSRAALRCEVHVLEDEGGDQWWQAFDGLKTSVSVMIKGITKLHERAESTELASLRQSDTLKRHAEEERGELEQRLKDASERAEVAESELLRVRTENERLAIQNEKLKQDLAIAEKAWQDLESSALDLRQERDEMQSYVEEYCENVSVLAEERDVARAREEELFYIINTKDEELLQARQAYMEVTQKMKEKDLESHVSDMADDMGISKEARAKAAAESERCYELLADNKAREAEVKDARAQAAELQARVDKLVAENKARESEVKKLQKKKEKLKKDNETLFEQLEASEMKRLEAKDKIVKLLERQEQLKQDRKKILSGEALPQTREDLAHWAQSPQGSARSAISAERMGQGAASRLLRRSSSIASSSSVIEMPHNHGSRSATSGNHSASCLEVPRSPSRGITKHSDGSSPAPTHPEMSSRSISSSTRDMAHSSGGWVVAEREPAETSRSDTHDFLSFS